MKVHSILAHPNTNNSLNASLFNLTNDFFKQQNYDVTTLNLFDIADDLAVAAKKMYGGNPNSSSYLVNWCSANEQGRIVDVVRDEINKLKQADLLYIQTPIWVYSMPAMLKSYIEQVFLFNEFFTIEEPCSETDFKINHLTQNKKVFVSMTTGGSKGMVSHVLNGIENLSNPIKSMFNFVGYEFLEPHVLYSTDWHDHSAFIDHLEKLFIK